MSSGRKPLIRNGSDRPTMRNWPLFVFLIGLVFFFYVFYIYQAQSTQLTMANDEIRLLNSQLVSTKNKLVDSLASLESANTAQKELNGKHEECNRKQEECMTSLRSSKLRVDGLEKNTKETSDNYTRIHEEMLSIKSKADELERNNTALLKMISTQDELITQLNQTINIMKFETNQLKSVTSSDQKIQTSPATPAQPEQSSVTESLPKQSEKEETQPEKAVEENKGENLEEKREEAQGEAPDAAVDNV